MARYRSGGRGSSSRPIVDSSPKHSAGRSVSRACGGKDDERGTFPLHVRRARSRRGRQRDQKSCLSVAGHGPSGQMGLLCRRDGEQTRLARYPAVLARRAESANGTPSGEDLVRPRSLKHTYSASMTHDDAALPSSKRTANVAPQRRRVTSLRRVLGRRSGFPGPLSVPRLHGVMARLLALLIALTLTTSCSYIQMQPKSGGAQPTPYAPRLP